MTTLQNESIYNPAYEMINGGYVAQQTELPTSPVVYPTNSSDVCYDCDVDCNKFWWLKTIGFVVGFTYLLQVVTGNK